MGCEKDGDMLYRLRHSLQVGDMRRTRDKNCFEQFKKMNK